MAYFKVSEFKCPCCGQIGIKENLMKLIEALEKAREAAGVPFIITSGYRCPRYNAKIGGAERSAHLISAAADIQAINESRRYSIIKGLFEANFGRIGIYPLHVHADIGDILSEYDSGVMWIKTKKEQT